MTSLTIAIPQQADVDVSHARGRSLARKPPSQPDSTRSHRPCRSLSAHHTGSEHRANIVAACRFRPLLSREREEARLEFLSEKSLRLSHVNETQDFTLDRIFPPATTQESIFAVLGQSVVEAALSGFNGTIFAYGQTGSGKTYTMIGGSDPSSQGLIPRCSALLLSSLKAQQQKAVVSCSMVEIYREQLCDLLQPNLKQVKIKESPEKGVFMHGIREVTVTSDTDILRILRQGIEQRTVAATALNQLSSRSHAIFTLKIASMRGVSHLNLVDLAGSERLSTLPVPNAILQDARKINLSLSVLGSVIMALASRADHVPYRDSKLTRVLQESLGGNCKTHVVVNCSSALSCVEETLMSLRFAQRTKRVRNEVFLAADKSDLRLQIDSLKRELNTVREELQKYKERSTDISLPPITPRTNMLKFTEHESSPSYFECSTTYRVLTENGEDWCLDSGKKLVPKSPGDRTISLSPEPQGVEGETRGEKVECVVKRQQREIAELRQERDEYRNSCKMMAEKLKQAAVKLKSSKSRQESDSEKRKILMLKITSDEGLITHMKSRISQLTKQMHQLTSALEDLQSSSYTPQTWQQCSLEAKLSIKESLCAIQSKQVVGLESAVDQLRHTTTRLRNEVLETYKELADAKFAQCSQSQMLCEFVDAAEKDIENIGRFSYTQGSGNTDMLARKLRLAEEELADREKERKQNLSALKQAQAMIRSLQEALTMYQMPIIDQLQGRIEGRPWTSIFGDTQPPEDV